MEQISFHSIGKKKETASWIVMVAYVLLTLKFALQPYSLVGEYSGHWLISWALLNILMFIVYFVWFPKSFAGTLLSDYMKWFWGLFALEGYFIFNAISKTGDGLYLLGGIFCVLALLFGVMTTAKCIYDGDKEVKTFGWLFVCCVLFMDIVAGVVFVTCSGSLLIQKALLIKRMCYVGLLLETIPFFYQLIIMGSKKEVAHSKRPIVEDQFEEDQVTEDESV